MKAVWLPRLVLGPSVLLVLVCVYGFIAYSAYLSITASRMLPTAQLVGAQNYHELLALRSWWLAANNLWIYALLYIGASLVLGLALAILIEQGVRAEGVWRAVFLYPMALSFIVTGTAWKWLLDPGVGLQGIVRHLGCGGFTFDWIVRGDRALYCIALAAVWQSAGFVMAMFLAGLRGLDVEPVHAARIDGARPWQVYLHVVIPQLGPVFASAAVVLATNAIRCYDLVVAMTSGGPGNATWLPSIFMYQYTFTRSEMGVGSASSVLMLGAIVAFVLPYLIHEYRRVAHG